MYRPIDMYQLSEAERDALVISAEDIPEEHRKDLGIDEDFWDMTVDNIPLYWVPSDDPKAITSFSECWYSGEGGLM